MSRSSLLRDSHDGIRQDLRFRTEPWPRQQTTRAFLPSCNGLIQPRRHSPSTCLKAGPLMAAPAGKDPSRPESSVTAESPEGRIRARFSMILTSWVAKCLIPCMLNWAGNKGP